MDLLELPEATMQTFTFHGWLLVEIFADDAQVGLGNAALAPQVTKEIIDLYLKPLLIGQDPWNIERLWQHVCRETMEYDPILPRRVSVEAIASNRPPGGTGALHSPC